MKQAMWGGTLSGVAMRTAGRHPCVPLPVVLLGVLLAVLPVVLVVVLASGHSVRLAALPLADVQAWQGEDPVAVTDAVARSSSAPSGGRYASTGALKTKGEGADGNKAATRGVLASVGRKSGGDVAETGGTQSSKGKEATGDAAVTGSGLASSDDSAGSGVPETPSVFDAEDGPVYYPGAGTTDASAGTSTKPSTWEPVPTGAVETDEAWSEQATDEGVVSSRQDLEPSEGVHGPGPEPKPIDSFLGPGPEPESIGPCGMQE